MKGHWVKRSFGTLILTGSWVKVKKGPGQNESIDRFVQIEMLASTAIQLISQNSNAQPEVAEVVEAISINLESYKRNLEIELKFKIKLVVIHIFEVKNFSGSHGSNWVTFQMGQLGHVSYGPVETWVRQSDPFATLVV